jgi:hypothetical protein
LNEFFIAQPDKISGLTPKQIDHLKRLHLTDSDWAIVIALLEVLAPYHHATKVFSGKTYQTLSTSFIFTSSLRTILEQKYSVTEEPDDEDLHKHLKSSSYYALVNSFKSLLLKATDIYHKRHITVDQTDASMVSFLSFSNN